MAYTRALDDTRPNGATVNAALIDDEMRYTRVDYHERLSAFFVDPDIDPPVMKSQANFLMAALGKFRLDGSLAGDTYIHESSANVVTHVVGGANSLILTATNATFVGTVTSGLINGQTISSAANFTGTLVVATSLSVTTGATLPVKITNVSDIASYGLITFNGVETVAGFMGFRGRGTSAYLAANVPVAAVFEVTVNNVARLSVVDASVTIAAATTAVQALTATTGVYSGTITSNAVGLTALKIVPVANGTYGEAVVISWYRANGSTRRSYLGPEANNDPHLVWANEEATGSIILKTNSTTALTINSSQAATFTAGISATTATFSGDLSVGGAAVASPFITINGSDATQKTVAFYSNSVNKWRLHSNATTHNFSIDSNFVTALQITQATGFVAFGAGISATTGTYTGLLTITTTTLAHALYKYDVSNYVAFHVGNQGGSVFNSVGSVPTHSLQISGATRFQIDATVAAGETALLLWDVDDAAPKRVYVGAADSGGSGYKLLRMTN